ncbi:Tyrosine recombinase XerC [bacterium HR36]|nr:Tyrosine recombinase XerC [bacterium HR36]
MVCVFRNSYTKHGTKQQTQNYYIRLKDYRYNKWLNIPTETKCKKLARRLANLLDKFAEQVAFNNVEPSTLQAIMQLPEKLINQLIRHGLLSETIIAARANLHDLLKDFIQCLRAKGRTHNHCRTVERMVQTIVRHCGFRHWHDFSAKKVEEFITNLRTEKNLSIKRCNHYIGAMKQFCRWLVDNGILSENPLRGLKKDDPEKDRRRVRRVPTDSELSQLLQQTRASGPSFGLSGEERYRLYLFAALTGLRSKEIASLRVQDVHLEETPPRIVLPSQITKNRKQAELPLHRDLIPILRDQIAGKSPEAPLFRLPYRGNICRMLRRDLQRAGIPYRTQEGVLDFHAFRAYFATILAASGVSVKATTDLMRHCDPKLSLLTYAKFGINQLADEINKVPSLVVSAPVLGNASVIPSIATPAADANSARAHTSAYADGVPFTVEASNTQSSLLPPLTGDKA